MEQLRLYDKDGKPTNYVIERGDKDIPLNTYIPVSIIFIQNDKNEFLIQRESKEKGYLYASTGGHIKSYENSKETIIREVKEELGLNIDKENIKYLKYIIVDSLIVFIYYLKKEIDITKLVLQKEEVDSVRFLNLEDINELYNNKLFNIKHYKSLLEVLDYKKENRV